MEYMAPIPDAIVEFCRALVGQGGRVPWGKLRDYGRRSREYAVLDDAEKHGLVTVEGEAAARERYGAKGRPTRAELDGTRLVEITLAGRLVADGHGRLRQTLADGKATTHGVSTPVVTVWGVSGPTSVRGKVTGFEAWTVTNPRVTTGAFKYPAAAVRRAEELAAERLAGVPQTSGAKITFRWHDPCKNFDAGDRVLMYDLHAGTAYQGGPLTFLRYAPSQPGENTDAVLLEVTPDKYDDLREIVVPAKNLKLSGQPGRLW